MKLNLQELTFGRNALNRLAHLIFLRILKHLGTHVNSDDEILIVLLENFLEKLETTCRTRRGNKHTIPLMNQSSRINDQMYFWLEELKTLIEAQRLMSLI